jgi:hypothetical protein
MRFVKKMYFHQCAVQNLMKASVKLHDVHTLNVLEIEAMNLQMGSHRTPLSTNPECPIDPAEERMRRKLRFFFMNPIEKWQAKRRFPYKFIVQVIKIVLVTAQV